MRGWLENSLYTPEGVEELLTDAYGRPAEPAEVDLYTAPLLREDMARAYVAYARGTGTVDLPIEQIATETLMIWGSADATIPAEHADVLEGRLPSVRRVDIEGAAHLPMETHLEETADAIVGWLGSID
jgi:pimeloyl-ACP methyl ester carboxylesterase